MKSKKELRQLFKKSYIDKNNLGGVTYPNEKAVVTLWYLTKNKEFANEYDRNYVVVNYLEKYKSTDFENIILFEKLVDAISKFKMYNYDYSRFSKYKVVTIYNDGKGYIFSVDFEKDKYQWKDGKVYIAKKECEKFEVVEE
ncbi:MAG: hypothetical protein IJ352_08315 [Muribaculaceae bacterium]|nr:hypothetical protein [Muribaculaceae bacterium]